MPKCGQSSLNFSPNFVPGGGVAEVEVVRRVDGRGLRVALQRLLEVLVVVELPVDPWLAPFLHTS